MIYEPLPEFTPEEVVAAMAGDDDVIAAKALFSVASCGMEPTLAESILLDAAKDPRVGRRRAAVVGLGYFARAQAVASPAVVKALENARAKDSDREVRGGAEDALSDIEMLG